MLAVVAANCLSVLVNYRAGRVGDVAVTRQEIGPACAREEAEVLALRLLRNGEAVRAGDRARGVLRLELAEREPDPPQRLGLQPREHVRLVLARVHRGADEGAL